MKSEKKAAEVLASNLNWLMAEHRYTERDLEKASGVSAKTINNIKNARHGTKIDVIEAVAAVFGLSVSLILSERLHNVYTEREKAERLADIFESASDDSRRLIMLVAEHESGRG